MRMRDIPGHIVAKLFERWRLVRTPDNDQMEQVADKADAEYLSHLLHNVQDEEYGQSVAIEYTKLIADLIDHHFPDLKPQIADVSHRKILVLAARMLAGEDISGEVPERVLNVLKKMNDLITAADVAFLTGFAAGVCAVRWRQRELDGVEDWSGEYTAHTNTSPEFEQLQRELPSDWMDRLERQAREAEHGG